MTDDCGPFYVAASQSRLNSTVAEMNNAADPPDTMGAMGPNHFIQIGNYSIKIYRRDGTTESNWNTTTAYFFAMPNQLSALGGAIDPRVIYDPVSATWFASAMERNGTDGTVGGNNNVILAVSVGSNPVAQSGTNWINQSWTKYRIPLAQAGKFLDFPTLGVDGNGVYIAANYFVSGSYNSQQIAAIRKDTLLAGTLIPTVFNPASTVSSPSAWGAIQPVVNLESVGPTAPAWFVRTAKGATQGIEYRYLTWDASHVPTFAIGWQTLANATYFGNPTFANSPPGTTDYQVALGGVGDRLSTANARAAGGVTSIWTCHGVQIYMGPTQGLRNGCEWMKLNINAVPNPQTLQINASGLVYDSTTPAQDDAMSYYFPSIAVNSRGDAIMGFSGSSKTQYISTYYTGRPSGGSMSSPILLHAGDYTYYKWHTYGSILAPLGDYSATFFDPKNPGTLWTFQTYAISAGCSGATCSEWDTWLNAISP
ncbi:MAG: hypothetical protein L0Z50_22705 [Verrucomicrobiales bacterium]|nr:hypothetical protein [Verrucomicrobiales bacterium]